VSQKIIDRKARLAGEQLTRHGLRAGNGLLHRPDTYLSFIELQDNSAAAIEADCFAELGRKAYPARW